MAEPARRPERPIVLVGLPGAGKTTVGRRLAERLVLPFFDTDADVERAAGLGVAAIFERHGEVWFRRAERDAVGRRVAGPPSVIAAGGGAFVDDGARALILARCTAVWLDPGVDAIARRIGSVENRPLLACGEPRQALAKLAEARGPLYARAHLAVRGDLAPDATVERILAALSERAA